MLITLLASQPPRTRAGVARFSSLMVHSALIAGAVIATERAVDTLAPSAPPDIIYRVPVDPAPPRPLAPMIPVVEPVGFRLVPTLIEIPAALPDVDLTRPLTDPNDYLVPRGVPGGRPDGEPTVRAIMTAEQVDRAVSLLAGTGRPSYPDALRSAGVGGEVLVQFVVDTLGRADLTRFAVVSSTHERFTDAVKRALAKARFAPAEFDGRRVPQLVRMPFVFSLK